MLSRSCIALICCVLITLTVDSPAHADGPTVTPGGGGSTNIAVTGSTGGGGGAVSGGPEASPGAVGSTTTGTSAPPNFTELAVTSGAACGVTLTPGMCFAIPGPAQGPVPPTPAIVDIATAVQVAITAANIQPIIIGITPEDLPGRTGLVGNPTWLWVKNPSESTIGPVNRVVTTGAVTVNLHAVLTSIVWNMGDGIGVVPCLGPPVAPYTPYVDVALNLPSPTCGYYYQRSSIDQPGGVWQVSATSMWLIFWSVATPQGGMGGVIPLAPTARTQIRTGELQVLVQPVP